MKSKRRVISEQEIDQRVIDQANDESAWEAPVNVRKSKSTTVKLPADFNITCGLFCAFA
jgi:hypothetical protein